MSLLSSPHTPVMLQEVLEILDPQKEKVYVDCTFGRGSYSKGILEKNFSQVIALDRDEEAVTHGKYLLEQYPDRFSLYHACFSEIESVLRQENKKTVEGIVLDLGVSSPQIDQPHRGFSFQKDGPLHMGMGLNEKTAADVVNGYDEKDLADIFWSYGDERKSRALARAVVEKRKEAPFQTTHELATLARKVIGKQNTPIDPATRIFQALRIYVNQELDELKTLLEICEKILCPGGKLIVVCFHSLEEKIVKKFFQVFSGNAPHPSRHSPVNFNRASAPPSFLIHQRKALRPSCEEYSRNPRARSARLRWGERSAFPALPEWMKRDGGWQ